MAQAPGPDLVANVTGQGPGGPVSAKVNILEVGCSKMARARFEYRISCMSKGLPPWNN